MIFILQAFFFFFVSILRVRRYQPISYALPFSFGSSLKAVLRIIDHPLFSLLKSFSESSKPTRRSGHDRFSVPHIGSSIALILRAHTHTHKYSTNH